jgi:endonuclease III
MKTAHAILEKLVVDPEFAEYRFPWSETRRHFTMSTASSFFIEVMLNYGQRAERAWEGAEHFVETHFPEDSIWKDIAAMHLNRLTPICRGGYEGTGYASRFGFNDFPRYLRENARVIVDKYDADPRKIWNVTPENVEQIYSRFFQFKGIGQALAKMAQFNLVRSHGVAGGIQSKQYLKAKPDMHVQRVLYRLGLSKSISPSSAIQCIEEAKVSSQADLDAVLFNVGRKFCHKTNPQCKECILNTYCKKVLITSKR